MRNLKRYEDLTEKDRRDKDVLSELDWANLKIIRNHMKKNNEDLSVIDKVIEEKFKEEKEKPKKQSVGLFEGILMHNLFSSFKKK